VIASAPGKLILTGEYAVLRGAPAFVVAVNCRAFARTADAPVAAPSPFLAAVTAELARRLGDTHAATVASRATAVDSSAFYSGAHKLGLGSSAAVTAAATALALGPDARQLVLPVALAAHAAAQGAAGTRGSGADVAAAVTGGALEVRPAADATPTVHPRRWPDGAVLLPFFTGSSADTVTLVARVAAARAARPAAVDAAIAMIAAASAAACAACATPAGGHADAAALIAAIDAAATAIDALAAATGIALVPPCVTAAQRALAPLGGVAKTTGAGGGDVAIAIIPAGADASIATAALIACGCHVLPLTVDTTGVDLRPSAQ
jgi:phosphomevalonate kinase